MKKVTDFAPTGTDGKSPGTYQPVARVLLVDDDPDVRKLLGAMIGADERFSVIGQAGDGDEALRIAASSRPDVVVLDLQMPDADGLVALPLLRQLLPHARIVVVSAFPDPYTFCDVVQRGADGYIDKARMWWELIPTLKSLCELG